MRFMIHPDTLDKLLAHPMGVLLWEAFGDQVELNPLVPVNQVIRFKGPDTIRVTDLSLV